MDEVPHIIQDILEKIIAGYAPQKVILFGSYAYGEPDEDSDIDLLIIKDTNEPLSKYGDGQTTGQGPLPQGVCVSPRLHRPRTGGTACHQGLLHPRGVGDRKDALWMRH